MANKSQTYNLNIYQAAKLLDYHPQTLRDLARFGKIPALKRRQKWYFCEYELADHLKRKSTWHVRSAITKKELGIIKK